jgi:hypothetical protein
MKTGVLYAMTDDGVNLPVIDVTNPAFAVATTDAELAAMSDQYVLESTQRQEIPAPLREALQRSILGRALMAASGTFLAGMNTYLLKLGPDNLGTDANPIDRRIAGSFPAFTTRLRLQDMARLLADGLSLTAAAEPRRPVCLINIGGGPASDSWNALIYLHAEHSDLLVRREIVIAVMDLDDHGPAFGVRAIGTLRAPAEPLSGLDIGFRHFTYEWSEADRLREALDDLHATNTACAVSSEGGLFEYGSDTEIVSNLKALHAGTASDAIVVGSVTRDGGPMRASQTAHRVSTRPRTIEVFRSLAEKAGWILQHVIERPFSYNVRLVKA